MKAVLIIDMPESCDICDFYDEDDRYPRCYCGVPGIGKDVTDYIASRPEWCPLRALPEPKEPIYKYESGREKYTDFAKGWNACLEAIEGRSNNE